MDEQIAADETFEALRTLEKIDHEIEAFANQLDELAPELSASGQRIAEMKARAEMLTKKADRVELRLRKFERASQAGRETLKRLQQRAQEVQNLKQHTAVRAETDAARRNLEAAEDDLLDAMQEAEEARGALAALARELSEEEAAYEALESETSARRAEIEAEISVQRDRRRNREMRLDADAVRLYESVRGGKTRKVLAPLTQDGVCGHCYTFIPVQRQAEIRGASRLYLCEGCGIILYPAG
jgi:predicted  nucleic acid-binding Zn-ribbon protein